MDTGSILIGIIMIVISLLPFILISKNRKKSKKEFFDVLKAHEAYNKLIISNSEFAGHFMIGADENKHQLFFIIKKKQSFFVDVIDLDKVISCTINKVYSGHPQDSENKIIQSVELQLIDNNNHLSDLELYNNNDHQNLSGELQIGQKWEKIINGLIRC